MEQAIDPVIARTKVRGRLLFLLGITLPFIALGAYIVQFQLHAFTMPWYVPIAAAIGLVAVAIAVWQRPGVFRIGGLVLVALFCAAQVLFFTVSKLPTYAGPAHAGEPVPAFKTVLADGRPFTDNDLKKGDPNVLLFFRGRW
jgi:hypothetical protein